MIDGPTCAHVRLPLWGDCLHPNTLKRTVQPHRVAREPALADAAAEAKQRVMDASPTLKYLLGPHGTYLEPVRAHWVLLREALFPVILHTRMDWVYARGQFPVAVQIACPCRSVYVRTDVAPCAHADTATPESTPHVGSGAGAGVPTTTENTQAEGGDRASIATGRVPDAVASRVCAQCNGTARLRPPLSRRAHHRRPKPIQHLPALPNLQMPRSRLSASVLSLR